MKKEKKINVINFPSKLLEEEREVEAIVFAAADFVCFFVFLQNILAS